MKPVLLSSPGEKLEAIAVGEGAPGIAVPMERGINPGKDLLSLSRLYRTIRDMRPTLADASTPKAGLLVGVAAWMAGVPCRIYTVRGLRMETATGLTRLVLRVAERISCACAHRVVCVSLSLRERVVELNLAPRKKTVVLGKGSSGIDLERFTPRKHDRAEVEFLCYRLGIPRGVPVLGYVGRLVKDKGIRQLVRAFDQLRTSYPNLHLLLVGEFESLDPVDEETRLYIESTPNVIRTGFVADTAPFYKLMDILAFPTHREGFGQVSLEAQASGVPVVTTNATGAIDSILPGVTGLLTPVGDSNALACAIGQLLADGSLRSRMGRAGRNWMERDFRPEVIWRAQSALYEGLIAEKCSMQPATASDRITKRVFDLGFALFALVLFSPLFVLVAVLVRLAFGSPILFRQVRPGLNAKPFQLLKFRTMTDARGSDGKLLADEDRLTRLGRFLRSTSLDELPELVNVIRGEMSLVGPRPLLPQYLERYTGEQMRRHSVRPGITGWAQVNGRNSVDWEQRFRQDLWYLDHQSLLLDLRILLKTVVQVFKREGISQAGHATMPEFLGVQAGREKGRA